MNEEAARVLELCFAWDETPHPRPTPHAFCAARGCPELEGPLVVALERLAAHAAAHRAMWGPFGSPTPHGPPDDDADEGAPPITVPGFEVLGPIGRGGMGVVYRVRDGAGRELALKTVRTGLHADRDERDRFLEEVRCTAALDHPNVVRLYSVGSTGGLDYFTLELVPGGSLAACLANYVPAKGAGRAEHSRRQRAVAALMAGAARGVHHAHTHNITHRDLKPANLLLRTDAHVCVADFGLARRAGRELSLTCTGQTPGTPHYMTPEKSPGAGARRPTCGHWA